MLFNYPPRIVKALNGAGIYTDEQVALNLDRLEELGLRSTDARRVRAKVASFTAAQADDEGLRSDVRRPVMVSALDGVVGAGSDFEERPLGLNYGGAELWTVRQVAGFLQLHRQTVARWCAEGRIQAIKLGEDWRIAGSEVMRLARGGDRQGVMRDA
jgi:excisionase family DNA binding protein